ncbi:MAG TPA: triose-phosphate isomerase family protein [Candidatus Paceibacterota bacterium]|nr:triose-phosphate isomerase family protein [Candidatus Paceibacterota bacterium]
MLILANWKAYVGDLKKARELVATAKRLRAAYKHEIVLAPPAPFIGLLAVPNRSKVAFAAQDISETTGGAATGEIPASAYRSAGATYAIIGHSERRAQGESDAAIAEKLTRALAHDLTPVLCVGERERDMEGRYLSFVREQITSALSKLLPKERSRVILAYEPVWAIGKTAADAISQSDLTEMVLYSRKVLAELLPGKSSLQSRVLYGGSVEPTNIRDLAGSSGVDGFLIGHASVDTLMFSKLVRELT